jgi:hypothetical protein
MTVEPDKGNDEIAANYYTDIWLICSTGLNDDLGIPFSKIGGRRVPAPLDTSNYAGIEVKIEMDAEFAGTVEQLQYTAERIGKRIEALDIQAHTSTSKQIPVRNPPNEKGPSGSGSLFETSM